MILAQVFQFQNKQMQREVTTTVIIVSVSSDRLGCQRLEMTLVIPTKDLRRLSI